MSYGYVEAEWLRGEREQVRTAGGIRRRRHVGLASESQYLTDHGTPKFAYHAFDMKFHPINRSLKRKKVRTNKTGSTHASQLVVHASNANAAAKKVVTQLHRARPKTKRHTFHLTQHVVLKGGNQNGQSEPRTRVYTFSGHYVTFGTPEQVLDSAGNVIKTVAGKPELFATRKKTTTGTRAHYSTVVTVPFGVHSEMVHAYKRLMAKKKSQATRRHKRHGGGGAATTSSSDVYDVEPRFGGAHTTIPARPIFDPYYYGIDPRAAGTTSPPTPRAAAPPTPLAATPPTSRAIAPPTSRAVAPPTPFAYGYF